ncbi:Ankyrin-3 [Fusarium oxysporum f. sp. albedinis]|nr:Ankyrin-3 [Fusarium oxysporum f. sp. albedinis]
MRSTSAHQTAFRSIITLDTFKSLGSRPTNRWRITREYLSLNSCSSVSLDAKARSLNKSPVSLFPLFSKLELGFSTLVVSVVMTTQASFFSIPPYNFTLPRWASCIYFS